MRGRDFRIGSRLCENSEVQFAWRNSVLVSLILEISCTDRLGQEKEIENIFLLVLGSRTFSHSLGHSRRFWNVLGMSGLGVVSEMPVVRFCRLKASVWT